LIPLELFRIENNQNGAFRNQQRMAKFFKVANDTCSVFDYRDSIMNIPSLTGQGCHNRYGQQGFGLTTV